MFVVEKIAPAGTTQPPRLDDEEEQKADEEDAVEDDAEDAKPANKIQETPRKEEPSAHNDEDDQSNSRFLGMVPRMLASFTDPLRPAKFKVAGLFHQGIGYALCRGVQKGKIVAHLQELPGRVLADGRATYRGTFPLVLF